MSEPTKSPLTNKLSITTHANGFGLWRAEITFNPPLSETAQLGPASDLVTQWPAICLAAREAILDELVPREQKTNESLDEVRLRLEGTLPAMQILIKNTDSLGLCTSVTMGEV